MSEVFRPKKKRVEPGFSVAVILNKKATKGKVGLEIEMEGSSFPKPEGYAGSHKAVHMPSWQYWSYVHDGSLRGKDNAEYVLTKPIEFDDADTALQELFDRLSAHKTKLDESNRTSVHVHLNCQEFHLNRLTSLMALYFIFEKVFTEWCGDHRVGNLFCLRAVDAPAIISQIKKFIVRDGNYEFSSGAHYSGLNASALHKFGSIEIRALRGCTELRPVSEWVRILRRLYDLSEDLSDPRDICGMFSQMGPMAFFDHVLGDVAPIVRQGVAMSDDEIRDSIYEGIRLAQDICYCRDWDIFRAMTLKSDPFGRDSRKIANKISMAAGGSMATAAGGLTWAPSPPSDVDIEMEDFDDDDPEPDYDVPNNPIHTAPQPTTQPVDHFASIYGNSYVAQAVAATNFWANHTPFQATAPQP